MASTSYLITGALLIQSATRQARRPITLAGAPDMAWVTRAMVKRLHEWASSPGKTFELLLQDGCRFTVAFRHGDGPTCVNRLKFVQVARETLKLLGKLCKRCAFRTGGLQHPRDRENSAMCS